MDELFEYLTVKEYAARMKVCERTVWRWIRRGLVDASRAVKRGHWRIKTLTSKAS